MNPYQPLRTVSWTRVGRPYPRGAPPIRRHTFQTNKLVSTHRLRGGLVVARSRATNSPLKRSKTLNSGYLGSRNDEERSEMRYVMRIAEYSESSNF